MSHARLLIIIGLWTTLFPAACTPLADRVLTHVEAHVAHDQMMYVREAPPTFGFQRLSTLMGDFPDLAAFIYRQGVPDFLAETGDRSQRYMIVYYLGRREAYACRTFSPRSKDLEFAGPYPITDGEHQTLDAIRKRATDS